MSISGCFPTVFIDLQTKIEIVLTEWVRFGELGNGALEVANLAVMVSVRDGVFEVRTYRHVGHIYSYSTCLALYIESLPCTVLRSPILFD